MGLSRNYKAKSIQVTERTEVKVNSDGWWGMTEAKEEKLPISDFYKVVDSVTIFKSQKWWEAIVVFESYGKRQIGMYLWQKKDDVWKRKHKFNVRNLDEWGKIKAAIEQLTLKLTLKWLRFQIILNSYSKFGSTID